MGTSVEMASAEPEQWKRAAAYRMHGERVDGNDLLAVREAADRLLRRAREERAPALLETTTYRFRGHSVADAGKVYRAPEEVAEARKHDPIDRFVAAAGHRRRDASTRMRSEVNAEIDAAIRQAAADPAPDPAGLFDNVYGDPNWREQFARDGARRPVRRAGGDALMADVTYREALRRALDEELARDERVFLMGEEIGRFEGSYKVTAGLYAKYGPRRVRETPIAEEGFVGAGVGAAMLGLRPGRRDHDDQLHPRGHGHGREPRGQGAPDVRRQGRRAARDPHARRRRRAADGAALAEPRGDVRAHARPQGRRAVDAARRLRAAQDGDPRRRPGAVRREPRALQRQRRAARAGRRLHGADRPRAGGARGPRPDDRRAQLHRAPRADGRRPPLAARHRGRGRRPALAAAAGRRDGLRRASRRRRARSWPRRAGRPTAWAPRSPRASRASASTTSTRRSSASAAPRRRCRTPSRSSSPR